MTRHLLGIGLVASIVGRSSSSASSAVDAGAATDAYATVPRCAPASAARPVALDALPTGACTGSATCQDVVDPCCAPLAQGDEVDGYTCTCTSGVWVCEVSAQGAGGCERTGRAPTCADAGD